MRTRPFDHLVFIGRFEPFHLGHFSVIERALELAAHVIVLVGSANQPRTLRNPWTASEREVMIRSSFGCDSHRLIIRPLRDHLGSDASWVEEVQQLVGAIVSESSKVGLIGYHKDRSSYYLKLFPQWELIAAPNLAGISASDLRERLFFGAGDVGTASLIKAAVPEPVFALLQRFRDESQFSQLVRERQRLEQ